MVASKMGPRRRKTRRRRAKRRAKHGMKNDERIFHMWLKEMEYWGFGGALSQDGWGHTIRFMIGRHTQKWPYTLRPMNDVGKWRLTSPQGDSQQEWIFSNILDTQELLFQLLSQRLPWKP